MRAGEFPDGARVLRAKIDMASPNINMRDPVLYRILHAIHPRTGDEWCIYPLYDFAHGQSDAIEGITHSLCTLEFEDHRPLYDWLIENLPVPSRPHQYEFARLNFTYTVLSKRFLGRLVSEGHVRGWDDPRMPTLSALRRRGFPPEGLRNFLNMVSLGGKGTSAAEIEMLEHEVRDVLNRRALRRFAVLRPLRLVIENYPEGQVEEVEAVNNPEDPSAGTRKAPFARELWIERDDFMEDPPRKFFRLAPGREVRLRNAYFVTCTDVVKDASGEIVELRCAYDPQTRGGDAPDGRRRRRRCTGSRPSTPCPPRCASMTVCSPAPIPALTATSTPTSTPTRRRCSRSAWSSLRSRNCRSVRPCSSSASATSARIPTRRLDGSSSTAPSASGTPGPSSRRRPPGHNDL